MRSRLKTRRGAVIVLVAILLVVLLAMVSFCVDFGYMVRVNAELQNAADATALVGACELAKPVFNGITDMNVVAKNSIAASEVEGQRMAGLNSAGSVNLTALTSDMVVGYMVNPTDQQATLSPWSMNEPLPNTFQVLLRRDNTANTPVQLFFARVLGINTWNCTARATAACQGFTSITGFKGSNVNGQLLPIAIDVNYWTTFILTGRSPDLSWSDSSSVSQPSANDPPTNVKSGSDGIPEFNDTYPNKNSPGNFGLVSIGPPTTSVPTYSSWILNGPSPSDLNYFGANGLQATSGQPATIAGGTGLKSTLVDDLASIVGRPRIIPLFSNYGSNGSNTQYTIVGFAGITIVSATNQGTNMKVVIQPMAVTDVTATPGNGNSSFIFSSAPVRLTR